MTFRQASEECDCDCHDQRPNSGAITAYIGAAPGCWKCFSKHEVLDTSRGPEEN